jgi:hypothetical protein
MVFKQLPDSPSGAPKASKVEGAIGAIAATSQNVVDLGRCASDERVEGDKTCGGALLNFILPAAVSRPFRQIVVGGTAPVPVCVEVSH